MSEILNYPIRLILVFRIFHFKGSSPLCLSFIFPRFNFALVVFVMDLISKQTLDLIYPSVS